MAKPRIRIIAVNDAVYPCWFADVVYACDRRWWQHHAGLPGFPGLKVSLEDSGLPDVRRLEKTGNDGFDPTPCAVRTAGNSGYQAVHLAAQLGASPIILVAFDMQGAPQQHWFGEHPDAVRCTARSWSNRVTAFAGLRDALAERGIELVNTSPSSALDFLRRQPLEAALSGIA